MSKVDNIKVEKKPYVIAQGTTPTILEANVCHYMVEGYEPIGGVVAHTLLLQTLILKKSKIKVDPDKVIKSK
jgi:hypothetical protein